MNKDNWTLEDIKKEIIRLERIMQGQPRFPNTVRAKIKGLRRKQALLYYMEQYPIRAKIKRWFAHMIDRIGQKLWDGDNKNEK